MDYRLRTQRKALLLLTAGTVLLLFTPVFMSADSNHGIVEKPVVFPMAGR